MNRHSLPRSHSRSLFHNDTIYSSTPQDNSRYFSAIHRPRPHMSLQQPQNQQQQLSHAHQYYSHSNQSSPWVASTPVSPPVVQEVYILDCKSCDTFLTNRGMRAVLLLQPDVPLYSSDALPVNCSANPGPSEYAPEYETETIPFSTLACPSGMPSPLPRTCECLTQTLCCHGCGNAVGYMVVIPCQRCCSSVSPTNRHTNRHRFVFFNKEINASERHYVPHEPGIIANSSLLLSSISPPPSHGSDTISSPSVSYHPHPRVDDHVSAGPTPPLPTPPPESALSADYTSRLSHASSSALSSRHHTQFPPFQFLVLKPERGKLCAGDVIYWHNLARNGEIPAVIEDKRARNAREPLDSPWAGR